MTPSARGLAGIAKRPLLKQPATQLSFRGRVGIRLWIRHWSRRPQSVRIRRNPCNSDGSAGKYQESAKHEFMIQDKMLVNSQSWAKEKFYGTSARASFEVTMLLPFSIQYSNSSGNWRMNAFIGQAAASPSAQNERPSTLFATSVKSSMSPF